MNTETSPSFLSCAAGVPVESHEAGLRVNSLSQCSTTALDGYRAAGMEIKAMLEDAQRRRPKRVTLKMQKQAGYRAGYHAGLLVAWCMHVYGEAPSSNAKEIKEGEYPLMTCNKPA